MIKKLSYGRTLSIANFRLLNWEIFYLNIHLETSFLNCFGDSRTGDFTLIVDFAHACPTLALISPSGKEIRELTRS